MTKTFVLFLVMAIFPKPVNMPDSIKQYCKEHPKECGI